MELKILEQTNKKPIWVRYVNNRMRYNKNFLMLICGETGSGKSYGALRYAETLDPTFNISRVCFLPRQFIEIISKGNLKKGNVILWDETGVGLSSKMWYSVMNKMINWVMQTFRRDNLIVIFTTPSLSYIDSDSRKLLHAYWQSTGIDGNKKIAYFKPFKIEFNSRYNKTYYKYLRDIAEPVMRVGLTLPSKQLIKDYEKEKKKFTESIKKDTIQELDKIEYFKTHKPKPQDIEIYQKYKTGNFTQAELGKEYNIHYKKVSRLLQKCQKYFNY